MRHDYNFPPDWSDKTPEEKSRWYTQVRACRQALRQDTPTARMVRKHLKRQERRSAARSGAVSLRARR